MAECPAVEDVVQENEAPVADGSTKGEVDFGACERYILISAYHR